MDKNREGKGTKTYPNDQRHMKNKLCEETIQYSSTYISYMYCEIP
jgi:hypothetical protein